MHTYVYIYVCIKLLVLFNFLAYAILIKNWIMNTKENQSYFKNIKIYFYIIII